MTKYEEMPLDTELQHGDRVTFSQPRQGEFLVLFACTHRDGRMGVILADEFMGIGELLHKGLKVTYVSRPIPEIVLPTVPGYYESERFRIHENAYAYLLTLGGEWWCGGSIVSESRMRELMPLTRLVPETAPVKLADRLNPLKVGFRMGQIIDHEKLYETEGAELIAAIDNGELDK